ncbi:MAG: hypothetical protein H5T41_07670 [Methanomassiliicoccales archaeon]|jgi:hypothetical protein|nr:hypothetical protein [Methanomassiliicoccales archaeon]
MKIEEITRAADRRESVFIVGVVSSPRFIVKLFLSYFSFLKMRKKAGRVFYNTLKEVGISEREARLLMLEYVEMVGLKRILSMMRRT